MSGAWDRSRPAPDAEDIVSCVACGLCLPHCPTFRLTGRETASPRGRIAAMRAVDEGRGEVDASFRTMMDECLACRACETACPSGVPFGRMVEAARAQAEPGRSPTGRLGRRVGLAWLLPRPWAVIAAGWATALAAALRLDRLLPGRPGGPLPTVRLRELARPLPREAGDRGPLAAVLAGCVVSVAYRPLLRTTMRLVAGGGHRARLTTPGGCCGALAMHHGHPEAARSMARQRIAEVEDADLVVVNAAGCSAHMKTYGELLADDPRWAAAAARVAARTRDVLELDLPVETGALGAVAMHDACHHLNGQGIAAQPRALLEAAGGEVCELADGGRCCGAAGLYSVTQPEQSARLRRLKAEAIVATGAPVVAVANPGCAMQIAAGLAEIEAPVRVAHPVELVGTGRARSSGTSVS